MSTAPKALEVKGKFSYFKKILYYLELARPDNWTKNLLIIPGLLLAYILTKAHNTHLFERGFIGFFSVSFVCSANYIINEWLDKDFDKYHPLKKYRLPVVYSLQLKYIVVIYSLFLIIGLCLSLCISIYFFMANLTLLLMGLVYNLEPLRTKDVIYLDVISESINNPIRLLLGWLIVTNAPLPSLSLLLTYWMGGAFVMAIKRYSELCFIDDHSIASKYRRSFQYYSAKKLLISSIVYAVICSFFWGMFVIQHKIQLLYLFPLYGLLFGWYLYIGLKKNSIAQHPEHIYKEKSFTLFALFVILITFFLIFIDVKI